MTPGLAVHGFALVALLTLSLGSAGPTAACSLVRFSDDGRYIGGGLTEQIADKADHIEVVRVSNRYLVQRTYTQGQRFLDFGEATVPAEFPEYTDLFVFELETVEVIKDGLDRDFGSDGEVLRIAGYDTTVWSSSSGSADRAGHHPNALPHWLFDRPGIDGYPFIGASENSRLGTGECTTPYLLEVGQTFLAFRDSLGHLYTSDGAFPLEIDVEFGLRGWPAERFSIRMQSLVPISGVDDPWLTGLRQALAARAR